MTQQHPPAAAKEELSAAGSDGTIYDFFKNLTSGKLTAKENPNIPFQLYISNFRRR